MSIRHIIELTNELSILLAIVLCAAAMRRDNRKITTWLVGLAANILVQQSLVVALPIFHRQMGMSVNFAYRIMFYSYWPLYLLQAFAMMGVVYTIYEEALEPFKPLRRLGLIVFRWAGAVALVMAIGISVGPHLFSPNFTGVLATQAEQFVNVLTLCLLIFVTFALRPLGLTFDSRLFGTSLGLGILATTSLIQAAWLSTTQATQMFSPIYLIGGIGMLAAMSTWVVYFVKPEPERSTLLVPTTSPYFLWNSISEALGDAPGYVAVNGLGMDMFSESELNVFAEAHPSDQAITVSPTLMRYDSASR